MQIERLCVHVRTAMRIRVEQAVVSGSALKIVASRRRKIYKTSSAVRRRDVRIHFFLTMKILKSFA